MLANYIIKKLSLRHGKIQSIYFLIFGLFFMPHYVSAQYPHNNRRMTETDDSLLRERYIETLRQQPLNIISFDSLSKARQLTSIEWMVKVATVNNRPQWSISVIGAGIFALPQKTLDGVTSSASGNAASNTRFVPSGGFQLGMGFNYFFFKKSTVKNPFLLDNQGNSSLDAFVRSKPFWSIHSGLLYQWDYFKYTQQVDMILVNYGLQIAQFQSKIALPLGFRFNLNLKNNKKDLNTNIQNVNINRQKIKPLSLFFGAGTDLLWLLEAKRRYMYADRKNSTDRFINSSGANERESPYAERVQKDFYRFQFDLYAEIGIRIRCNSKTKLPQYCKLAIQYKFPFLTNLKNSVILANQETIDRQAIYTAGYRDILYTQSFGALQLSLAYEFQKHRIR